MSDDRTASAQVVGPSCATCSDEALPARVLRIDEGAALAVVLLRGEPVEVDISLVDDATVGDLLLVHGGVAIANLGPAQDDHE